jgi:hypothetical protein
MKRIWAIIGVAAVVESFKWRHRRATEVSSPPFVAGFQSEPTWAAMTQHLWQFS